MKVKCKRCGTLRTSEEAYHGKYAINSPTNLEMLSDRNALILNCPVCGKPTRHEVI